MLRLRPYLQISGNFIRSFRPSDSQTNAISSSFVTNGMYICIYIYIYLIYPSPGCQSPPGWHYIFLYGKTFICDGYWGAFWNITAIIPPHPCHDLVSLSHTINAKETRIRVPPKSGCGSNKRITRAAHTLPIVFLNVFANGFVRPLEIEIVYSLQKGYGVVGLSPDHI